MNGRELFKKTLIIAVTLASLYLLWLLKEIVLVLLGAIIFASAIQPLVRRTIRWRIPTSAVILLIYGLVILSLASLLYLSFSPLYAIAENLANDDLIVRRISGQIIDWSYKLGYEEQVVPQAILLPDQWRAFKQDIFILLQQTISTQGFETFQQVITGVGQLILALVMSFYWLTERDAIIKLLLSLTSLPNRKHLSTIIEDVEQTLGAYVRGTIILMLAVGLSTFVGLLILQVPYAFGLAVIAGLSEAIPMVGPALGAVPAILMALNVSPTTALFTALLFMLIQFVENNIFVPRIMGQSVGLNPLVVLIAFVAGGSLYGITGTLFAIPLMGAFQVILRGFLIDPMLEEAALVHEIDGIPIFERRPDELSDDVIIRA